jgi:hypothetical protein
MRCLQYPMCARINPYLPTLHLQYTRIDEIVRSFRGTVLPEIVRYFCGTVLPEIVRSFGGTVLSEIVRSFRGNVLPEIVRSFRGTVLPEIDKLRRVIKYFFLKVVDQLDLQSLVQKYRTQYIFKLTSIVVLCPVRSFISVGNDYPVHQWQPCHLVDIKNIIRRITKLQSH